MLVALAHGRLIVTGRVFSNGSGSDVDAAAAAWIAAYERNSAEAMRDLVNFVLRASGCASDVTIHDIEDQDNITGRLGDLQDEFQTVSDTMVED